MPRSYYRPFHGFSQLLKWKRKNPSTPLERAPLITTLRPNLAAIYIRNRRFSYPVRRFRCMFVITRRMYSYGNWREDISLHVCARWRAIIEVKFWAEKFHMFFNFAFKFRLVNEFCHSPNNFRTDL